MSSDISYTELAHMGEEVRKHWEWLASLSPEEVVQ